MRKKPDNALAIEVGIPEDSEVELLQPPQQSKLPGQKVGRHWWFRLNAVNEWPSHVTRHGT
jgi:hypothetical protein